MSKGSLVLKVYQGQVWGGRSPEVKVPFLCTHSFKKNIEHLLCSFVSFKDEIFLSLPQSNLPRAKVSNRRAGHLSPKWGGRSHGCLDRWIQEPYRVLRALKEKSEVPRIES